MRPLALLPSLHGMTYLLSRRSSCVWIARSRKCRALRTAECAFGTALWKSSLWRSCVVFVHESCTATCICICDRQGSTVAMCHRDGPEFREHEGVESAACKQGTRPEAQIKGCACLPQRLHGDKQASAGTWTRRSCGTAAAASMLSRFVAVACNARTPSLARSSDCCSRHEEASDP